MRAGIGVGLALVLAAVLYLGTDRLPEPLRPGDRAPNFSLPRLDGSSLALDDLRGRVVLVNFWATWCAPCEAEMPAMQRLYDVLGTDGFELVAVSVDEDTDSVHAFRDRLSLGFPILLDPGQEVATAYQTFKFPETLLIDQDGILLARFIGERDWDAPAWVEHIQRLISGDASAWPASLR